MVKQYNYFYLNKLKTNKEKSYLIGFAAFLLTSVHTYALRDMGEPKPYPINLAVGLFLALLMHGNLWLCIFQTVRIKLRYLLIPWFLFSGILVLMIRPSANRPYYFIGIVFAIAAFIFYLWLVYDLWKNRKIT